MATVASVARSPSHTGGGSTPNPSEIRRDGIVARVERGATPGSAGRDSAAAGRRLGRGFRRWSCFFGGGFFRPFFIAFVSALFLARRFFARFFFFVFVVFVFARGAVARRVFAIEAREFGQRRRFGEFGT